MLLSRTKQNIVMCWTRLCDVHQEYFLQSILSVGRKDKSSILTKKYPGFGINHNKLSIFGIH
jgi:hypothetical protein